jgi:hypothetical protein
MLIIFYTFINKWIDRGFVPFMQLTQHAGVHKDYEEIWEGNKASSTYLNKLF